MAPTLCILVHIQTQVQVHPYSKWDTDCMEPTMTALGLGIQLKILWTSGKSGGPLAMSSPFHRLINTLMSALLEEGGALCSLELAGRI